MVVDGFRSFHVLVTTVTIIYTGDCLVIVLARTSCRSFIGSFSLNKSLFIKLLPFGSYCVSVISCQTLLVTLEKSLLWTVQ